MTYRRTVRHPYGAGHLAASRATPTERPGGVVAHFALERARFTPGETVLVRGAAGSIGITAVQLAARQGASELPLFPDKLNSNGRFVAVGVVGGQPPADFGMRLMDAFRRSLSFATFSSDTVPGPAGRAGVPVSDAAHGDPRTVVHEVLPLEQAASAHRRMDAGEIFGRIVLTP